MGMPRREIDAHLSDIEAKLPTLLENATTFRKAFKDELVWLLSGLDRIDQEYALERLEDIVSQVHQKA